MPQEPAEVVGLPEDVAAIRSEIQRFFGIKDDEGRNIGGSKHGVYAFYDYDGEPIYVGQTEEQLSSRISRHLTNQRTDAVAMNVLDPFEVASIEVWPLDSLVEGLDKKAIKEFLSRAEYTVFQKVLRESALGAALNEKEVSPCVEIALPDSYKGCIIPEAIYLQRKHPDVRIARRATTIANLARVISERDVSDGLRRTLLTQAKRLERLAGQRVRELGIRPDYKGKQRILNLAPFFLFPLRGGRKSGEHRAAWDRAVPYAKQRRVSFSRMLSPWRPIPIPIPFGSMSAPTLDIGAEVERRLHTPKDETTMTGLFRLFAPVYSAAPAAEDPVTPERLRARAEFQDMKFGLFIHWGVYSTLGAAEWVMNDKQIHIEDYEKLPDFFNPIAYDPAEWVALARRAGMKYITITTKHHDGFAMYHSKVSDWNVVDRTPYKRDVLRMLVDECNKAGVKIIFYHSHLDWRHHDYFPRGVTGHKLGRPEKGDWYPYLDYMDAQIMELCTNYGEIGGFWFDGFWDRLDADWRLERTYNIIHSLQPKALIGNNHHVNPFPGEDYQMWERDLPGNNASGYNVGTKIGRLPLETCDTLCGVWGFSVTDRNYKTPRQLVHYLARAAGNNANFLLNVGPMPNGKIQPEFVERLETVGRWMDANAESIHGTRGGPGNTQPWAAVTHSDEKVYIHILEPEKIPSAVEDAVDVSSGRPGGDQSLRVYAPIFATIQAKGVKCPTVRSAVLLRDGKPADFRTTAEGVIVNIPRERLDEYDTVVSLSFEE